MSDCGCYSKSETELVMCSTHWSAMHLRAYQHGAPHEDCCDMSLLKGELRDSGRETVEAAIESMPERDRAYWRGLMGRIQ